jgi:hypothetical protein
MFRVSGSTAWLLLRRAGFQRVKCLISTKSTVPLRGGSWNIFSISGGADNISFNKTLGEFYSAHILGSPKPWEVKNWVDCPDTNALYATIQSEASNISSDLRRAVGNVRLAARSTRFVDLLYPYVVKTDNVCATNLTVGDPTQTAIWHGATDVIDALNSTHSVLSGSDIAKIDLRTVFGPNPLPMLQLTRYFGYPHADMSGQRDTAAKAALLLRQ